MGHPDTSPLGRPEPWIETRRGGLFFVNALFVFPHVMLLVPLATRLVVRGVLGGLPQESTIVDTFPQLAEHLLPIWGWALVVPIWLTVKALRLETARWPRFGLWCFLAMHLLLLGWTVGVWTGLVPPEFPGRAGT